VTPVTPNARGLITTEQAAALCGVQPCTIRKWISRGYSLPSGEKRKLPVVARCGRGALFDPVEVAKAEYATRERARRLPAAYRPAAA
jgi:hypothetical protein